ncbi:MAG: carboxylesterase family protein [Paraburkholderia fungorum]|nr:carboxylesterase family protein [Paraburkholderia fungorum]
MTSNVTEVSTPAGVALGVVRDNVRIFRGIRYGCTQAGAGRFQEVKPFRNGNGPISEKYSVFPQLRSRLADVMGDAVRDITQAEDAFLLDVWAPADASRLPVLVFLHGGAFISGGGCGTRYDGFRLASEESVVVVTLNYRLGAMGHLFIDGVSHGNLPFGDILCALRWVQENVGSFGGDSANVTVAGQSAGAWYAHLLAVSPASRGLLRRNVLLSIPHYPPMPADTARETGRFFTSLPGGSDPHTMPVDTLLAAQREVMTRAARFGDLTLGFYPVVDGDVVPEWLFDYRRAAEAAHVETTLVGYTRDENAAFLSISGFSMPPDEHAVTEWFRDKFGSMAEVVRSNLDRLRDRPSPYTSLVDGGTWLSFALPAHALVDACSQRGIRSWLYRFDLPTGSEDILSPHCLELPFLFGNREDWDDARMLARIPPRIFEAVSSAFRHAIARFVHGELPASRSGNAWDEYSAQTKRCNLVTAESEPFSTRLDLSDTVQCVLAQRG